MEKIPLEKAHAPVFIDIGNLTDRRFMVWWYGVLSPNRSDKYQPKVTVLFREIDNEGILLNNFQCKRVNVTSLGFMRIGTVWHDGKLVARASYTTKILDVNFSPAGWHYSSIGKNAISDERRLIPRDMYPIFTGCPNAMADSWLLHFSTDDENTSSLLIPCMEFFSRCYGFSETVKRILVTLPWSAAERRFFATPSEPLPSNPGTWAICLGRDMLDDDALFLAHLKYDSYARNQAKQIWSQAESMSGTKPIFLKVSPWNQGLGNIRVAGINIQKTKTFLALNILGMSPPRSPNILYDRANTNKTEEADEDTINASAWTVAVRATRNLVPEGLSLAEDESPDQGTGAVDLDESKWEWLGRSPVLIPIRRSHTQSTRDGKAIISPSSDSVVSAGEPHGTGKGIRHASIHAPIRLESKGTPLDMWEAFRLLVQQYPDNLRDIGFFTFDADIQKGMRPFLIPFQIPKKGSKGYTWSIIDAKTGRQRGASVTWIRTSSGYVFIMEIERRIRATEKTDGTTEKLEESFSGLVFRLKNERELRRWVALVMETLPAKDGVFSNGLLKCFPGLAWTFRHVSSKNDTVPCESAARNALEKAGVTL